MEEAVITGIASDTSEVKVTIRQVPDAPNVAARVFGALARANVNLDMIIQNVSEAGFTDISFTTPGADLPRAKETMERIVPEIGAREFIVDEDIAKVSLVGTGMKSSPGVASRTFQTLGDNNINIVAISTSPIRLSMIVDAAPGSTGRPVPAHRLRARFRRRVRGNPAFSGRDRRQNEERTLNDLDEGNAGKSCGGRSGSDGCGGTGVSARAA